MDLISNIAQYFIGADYVNDPLGIDLENSSDGLRRKWNPSIHMPRSASRTLLEITNVRVERLQDISEYDAMAEGVTAKELFCAQGWSTKAYRKIWESINGQVSWDQNPWVWVISLR